jgi:iron complex transport system substrate-binding protein
MTLRVAGGVLAIAVTLGSAVAAGQDASAIGNASPVTIENCGVSTRYPQPPRRVVTMNQSATELMLALELQDRLVGTAFLDDAIFPAFSEAYKKIPVLAPGYPDREALLAVEPDFVLAAYSSAFTDQGVGPRADLGVAAYLSPSSCPGRGLEPLSMATLYREIREIGRIFGVAPRAEQLIASSEADLRSIQTRIGTVTSAPRVFWYDSGSPPLAGTCCGMPNEILRLAGAENIFKDTPGSWTAVSWGQVVEKDPDVIVLVDAPWSSAADKAMQLNSEARFATIAAVMRHRFVTIDFSSTTPGIRTVEAVRRLAKGLYPEKFDGDRVGSGDRPRQTRGQQVSGN